MQSFCEQVDEDDLAIPSHHSPLNLQEHVHSKRKKKRYLTTLVAENAKKERKEWWRRCVKVC